MWTLLQNRNKKFGAEVTCLTGKKALSEQYANECGRGVFRSGVQREKEGTPTKLRARPADRRIVGE